MSEFKAKYHALHILQRLSSADSSVDEGGRQSRSPWKPGIRSSDDILKEKYAELAKIMAMRQLEKQAVSALQNMYVSPRKSDSTSRRRRRRREEGEKGKKKKQRENGDGDSRRKNRPESASSTSSHSSANSHSSNSSFVSNASRSSSNSNASKSSARSNASKASSRSNTSKASSSSTSSRASSMKSDSSRSSTSSKSSQSSKPLERHFVTIVEEEEVEEIVNQDKIEERQVVRFDEELAEENEEEARRKKDASKRTRRVSFVLEAQEEGSESSEDEGDEDSDNTLKGDESYVREQDRMSDSSSDRDQSPDDYDNRVHDDGDLTPKYIEIEKNLLRELLSPRSPRRILKLSPREEERSSPRRKSRSPVRNKRGVSPKRAWEMSDTIPLPPKPQKDVKPCDHKLSKTDNPEIRKWLRHKNALIRRQKKEELKKEKEKELAAEAVVLERLDKFEGSGQIVDTWMKEKRKEIRKQKRIEKRLAKEEKKLEEEERAKRMEAFQEKQRMSIDSFGDKVPPTPRGKKKKKQKPQKDEAGNQKNASSQKKFPSSNPFKGLSYDQWMKQKLETEEKRKRQEKVKQKSDPELETVIPNMAKERIERAKTGRGKRTDTGLRKEKEDQTECSQPSKKGEKPKPYTWRNDGGDQRSSNSQRQNLNKGKVPGKTGIHRPSSATNRLPSKHRQADRSPRSSSTGKSRHSRMFSPSFARPEPQGSESNDDHSERSAKIATDSQEIIKYNKSGNQNRGEVNPDDKNIFLTEFGN